MQLHGEYGIGSFRGQPRVERIDQECQQRVVAHEHGQLNQALLAQLLQCSLKSAAADVMGPVEFLAIVDHSLLIGRELREFGPLPQSVDYLGIYAGGLGGGGPRTEAGSRARAFSNIIVKINSFSAIKQSWSKRQYLRIWCK